MDVSMHGLCTGGEVVQAAGTDEVEVVMCSPQVVYHCPLILALLPTPGAESQATSPL